MKLRATPSITFLKMLADNEDTRRVAGKLEKIVQYGKLTASGLIYKDTENNNASIVVSKEVLEFIIEVDAEVICFVSRIGE